VIGITQPRQSKLGHSEIQLRTLRLKKRTVPAPAGAGLL
jgi:hypothetical protein